MLVTFEKNMDDELMEKININLASKILLFLWGYVNNNSFLFPVYSSIIRFDNMTVESITKQLIEKTDTSAMNVEGLDSKGSFGSSKGKVLKAIPINTVEI